MKLIPTLLVVFCLVSLGCQSTSPNGGLAHEHSVSAASDQVCADGTCSDGSCGVPAKAAENPADLPGAESLFAKLKSSQPVAKVAHRAEEKTTSAKRASAPNGPESLFAPYR